MFNRTRLTYLVLLLYLTTGTVVSLAQTVIRAKGFHHSLIENRCIVIDDEDNVYLGGTSYGDSVHFDYYHLGPISISEMEVGYVAKLNSELELMWARPIQGEFRSECNGLVTDGSGGVVGSVPVINWVEGVDTIPAGSGFAHINENGVLEEYVDADLGDGYRIYNAENGSIYGLCWTTGPSWELRKFDASGNVLVEFPSTVSGDAQFSPMDMTTDANGNIYICGYYHTDYFGPSNLVIDGVSLPIIDDEEYLAVLIKCNSNGSLQWLEILDVPASAMFTWVEYDAANDRIIAAGGFRESIVNENQDTIYSIGSDDMVVSAYSLTGDLLAMTTGGTENVNSLWNPHDIARTLRINSAGEIYTICRANQLSGLPIPLGNYLVKYDSDLNLIWVKEIELKLDHNMMTLDNEENLIIAGFLDLNGSQSSPPFILDSVEVDFYHSGSAFVNPDDVFTVVKIVDDNSLKPITGKVYVDENSNGAYDVSEHLVQNNVMSGVGLNTSHTGLTGTFAFFTSTGSYSFSPTELSYYTLTPSQRTIILDSASTGAYNQDFRLVANGQHEDLKVSVGASGAFRPGFGNTYTVTVTNLGTVASTGMLEFGFSSNLNLINAAPIYDQISGNTLGWDIQGIQPFGQRTFQVEVEVPVVTALGDTVVSIATVSVNGQDENLINNEFISSEVVVGSYDPNDKRVLPDRDLEVVDLAAPLQYTIRFQNTGTYPAEIVRIIDTLSSVLDFSTVETIGASHDHLEFRREGNVLE